MAVQTTYGEPAEAVEGLLSGNGPREVASANNSDSSNDILPGRVVFKSGDRLVRPILASDVPTATTGSVIASGVASATTIQNITTFNGPLGAGPFYPARQLALTTNAHADWVSCSLEVKGVAPHGGGFISETVEFTPGTLAATHQHFEKFLTVVVPRQGGTNGTLIAGLTANPGPLGGAFGGVAIFDPASADTSVSENEKVSCLKSGKIWMVSETSGSAGQQAYTRISSSGDEIRGQVRNDSDGNDAAPLHGSTYVEDCDPGLALIEVRG